MPRQVSHDQRRQEIVEALWRVAVRGGLASVSFREVAAEAGVSVRRVQYYFGSKAQLLAGALRMLGQRAVARSLEEMQALGPEPSPRALLRAATTGALPTDEDSRTSTLLFFSFYIAAITDPALASADALTSPEWTVGFAAELIRQAVDRGQAREGIDPDKEAVILMSAFSGLSLSIIAGLQTPDDAIAAIDYQLDKVFSHQDARTGGGVGVERSGHERVVDPGAGGSRRGGSTTAPRR
jgi:AcrR family transcriptional regulator